MWCEPPVEPSRGEARDEALRELTKPEYNQVDPLMLFIRWVNEILNRASGESTSWASAVIAVLIVAALIVIAYVVISRWRTTFTERADDRAVELEKSVTASDYHQIATSAYATKNWHDVVQAGFRAMARTMEERDIMPVRQSRTADEVGTQAIRAFASKHATIREAVRIFDEVSYGGRSASQEQAELMLSLAQSLVDAPVETGPMVFGPDLVAPQ